MNILLGMACLLLTVCTPRATAVAIRPVTVVDVINGSLRGNQTVLVAGSRITAVGAADQVRIPDDADLLDATGGFLIPGLWDMHVHSVANGGGG
jgi:imidazolonepropionase-like amidohydrolase